MKVRAVALAFALLCSPGLVFAEAALKLPSFKHLQDKSINTVNITIDSGPMRLASSFLAEEDPDLKRLLAKLDQIQLVSYEFDSDHVYSRTDIERVRKQLSGPNWSPLVQVRSAKENATVDICIFREDGKVSGFALVAAEPRKLTILNIAGSIDADDVAKLQGQLGVPDLGLGR
jgi:hypothetical protein